MSKKIDNLAKKYGDEARFSVHTDGNYTIVEVKYSGFRTFGIAKRNPSCDVYIFERGQQIATARALRNLDNLVTKYENEQGKAVIGLMKKMAVEKA